MKFSLPPENIPKHIAIIMDGNGRWAAQKNKPRIWGHRVGSKTVDEITEECATLGVSQLTLYAFSYENWDRPAGEVNYLMTLLKRFVIKERSKLNKNNIKFEVIGRLEKLPKSVHDEIKKTIEMTRINTGMTLCLAISYGGRAEIIDATKKIANDVASGKILSENIDENLFKKYLYQPEMKDPDLLIRTAGEVRVSNFLLWQISYSELWITNVLWPDFKKENLYQAILDYNKRNRKFGKVKLVIGA